MNESNFVTIKQLGELAKACREEAGLNQNEVASLIGTSQSNVSAAESGKSTRYATVAIRIIEALGQKTVKGPFFLVENVDS
jgi:transcriptional regulator with XRE-family HTH domain